MRYLWGAAIRQSFLKPLLPTGIPTLSGGGSFFNRHEVKDVVAYLRLLVEIRR